MTAVPRPAPLPAERWDEQARAEYEWLQHAAIGRRAGLTDAHLAAVAPRLPGTEE